MTAEQAKNVIGLTWSARAQRLIRGSMVAEDDEGWQTDTTRTVETMAVTRVISAGAYNNVLEFHSIEGPKDHLHVVRAGIGWNAERGCWVSA